MPASLPPPDDCPGQPEFISARKAHPPPARPMTISDTSGPEPPAENHAARCEVFEQHILKYQKRYAAFVMSLGCSEEDAQEIVQEAFISVYRKWMAGTHLDEAGLQPYLYHTLRNGILQYHRSLQRHKRIVNTLTESLDAEPGPSGLPPYAAVDALVSREFSAAQAAADALADLSQRLADVIQAIPFTLTERKVIAVISSPDGVQAACRQHHLSRDSFYRLREPVLVKLLQWLTDHP